MIRKEIAEAAAVELLEEIEEILEEYRDGAGFCMSSGNCGFDLSRGASLLIYNFLKELYDDSTDGGDSV